MMNERMRPEVRMNKAEAEPAPQMGLSDRAKRRAILATTVLASAIGVMRWERGEDMKNTDTIVQSQTAELSEVHITKEQQIREMQMKVRAALAILEKINESNAESAAASYDLEEESKYDITAIDVTLDDLKIVKPNTVKSALLRAPGIGDENVEEAATMYQLLREQVNIDVVGEAIVASLDTPEGGFDVATMIEIDWNESGGANRRVVSYHDGSNSYIQLPQDVDAEEVERDVRSVVTHAVDSHLLKIVKLHYKSGAEE